MRLPENTTSGQTRVEYVPVLVLHATAPVYHPAPEGGSYCNTATCTHDHPDTPTGRRVAEECAARLARIIESGRLPEWATLAYPVGGQS